MSGHERSCILSGQQRTGRCTCRTSNRDAHPNDNSSARASISRIVMLAEALFEVRLMYAITVSSAIILTYCIS